MKEVYRLQVRNVSKTYGNCLANNQINLTIQRGEIHALLGENGAGKSTLMKIIYGLVRPDAGEVFWQGEKINLNSPYQARMLGVGMVFQHFSLFESLTVTENIALALTKTEKWDLSRVDRKIRILSNEYGLSVNPDRPIHTLAVGERQRVEIIRCLFQTTKLLILDEPTAVLTPQEIEKLFAILRRIAANGCSILFSSHKLKEVQSLCSHATVLRNGAVVQECNPQRETPASLARMMIGSDVLSSKQRQYQPPGPICLQVQDLCLKPKNPFGTTLQNINLQLHVGEIVGIAGVAGNGQSELLSALSGEFICPKAEMIMLGEMAIARYDVSHRRRLGLAYAPEDRLSKGVVPNLSLQENALLTTYGQGLVRRGMIRFPKLKNWTVRICAAFNVKQAGVNSTAASLSGGNLQKFIMGREINQNPAVMIAAHPSWGVDIKATASIHEALIEMRDNGAAVLVISEDLDELFVLCDRLGVIYKGQLSPLKSIQDTNRDEIGRLMGGIGA
ncbi:ABC transporter ATP-binding protein [Hassallia byssoidea VB512170]|uniref:ABC transporter ATP-binding protein n=1 Tax=Hassallia byssoidea VB512170 TaxID=1304833 RepID=A0A846HAI1_9CYAN|nr:ABC transporter ATP-binding protein [Hassalia byssoidea]NEU73590.1 ABC transporter ATP-binding protein [Hassalia byssoidea VB512170]